MLHGNPSPLAKAGRHFTLWYKTKVILSSQNNISFTIVTQQIIIEYAY